MKLYGDYPQTFGRVKSVVDNPAQYACAIERTRSTDYSPSWYVWIAACGAVTALLVWVTR